VSAPATSYVLNRGVITGLYAASGDAGSNGNATWHGGPVIGSAQLVLIYWGSSWSRTSTGQINTAVEKLLSTSYFSGLTQYGFQGLDLTNMIMVPSDPPTRFDTTAVADLVEDLIAAGTVPAPNDPGGRILYVAFMPPGVVYTGSGTGAHSNDGNVWAAWVGNTDMNQNLAGMMSTFSHEVAEAISDPEPHSGFTMDTYLNCGVEIGDACQHSQWFVGGVQVQAYWSQELHSCVIPTLPPPTITSISPASGPMTGNTTVQITGNNFDVQQGGTQVFFKNTPAQSVSCTSPTSCTAVTPLAPQIGPVDVTLNVNTFPAVAAGAFTYKPAVTDVNPSHGLPGDQIVISGYEFNYDPSVMTITIGPYKVNTFSCTTTSCTLTVPQGCGGGNVQVTIEGIPSDPTPKNAFNFDGRYIESFDPYQGASSGGTDVNLTGVGFVPGMQVAFVDAETGAAVNSDNVLCPSSTWCVVRSPSHQDMPGWAHIVATVPGCPNFTAPGLYVYLPKGRMVSGLSIDGAGNGQVQLDNPAGTGGAPVALSSSDPNALQVPSGVTVPAGATSASFKATFVPIAVSENVTVTASFNSTSATTTVPIAASAPLLALDVPDTTIPYLATAIGTVTLTPAPSADTVVMLSCDAPSSLTLPANVTVAAHTTSASFSMKSQYSGLQMKTVTVTAQSGTLSTSNLVDLKRSAN
jgi:hypothetical protein